MRNNKVLNQSTLLGFPIIWWSILVLALGLRVVLLDGSLWMDEAAQVLQSVRPFSQQHLISADFQPPLLHYITHFISGFSLEESWLRISSVFAGLGMIWLSFLISRELSFKHDWLAGLFLAISPFHIFFSQELRPYSLSAFFTVYSWFFVLKLYKSSSSSNWIGLVITNLLSWYSMYVSVFFSLFQFILLIFKLPKLKKKTVLFFGIAGLLYLPWTPFLFEQFQVASSLTSSLPGWSSIVGNVPWKSMGLVVARFLYGIDPVDFTFLTLSKLMGVVLFLGISALIFFLFRFEKKFREKINFIFWISLSPLGLIWIVSFFLPILQPKRVMAAQIGVALLLPLVMELKPKIRSRILSNILPVSMIILFFIQAFGVGQYWTDTRLQREQWREVVAELHETFSVEQTIVVFGFTAPFSSWEWYAAQRSLQFSTVSFPSMPIDKENIDQSMQRVRSYNRVLILDYLRDVTDPNREIEKWLERNDFMGVASYDTVNFGFIRVYEKQSLDIQAMGL